MIWIFCCKKDYLKIEKFQCNALKVIYNSSESYVELLTRSNEVPTHQKHVRTLATEIYIVCTCTICKLCIMNEYHCNYDIYNVQGLVFISLGYKGKIL